MVTHTDMEVNNPSCFARLCQQKFLSKVLLIQDFRRRYNLVPLVKQDKQEDMTNARTRATVNVCQTEKPAARCFLTAIQLDTCVGG